MPDAARYHRLQLVLAAAGLALSTAYLLAALLTGAAHALAGAAAAATATAWGQVALVASILGAARAFVFPVWIVPLFYRLTPLADEELRERLLTLARRAGVPVVGVWIVDQSRKSRTANAAVVGLGRTRRIVLFDTLATGFTPEEI